MQGNDKVTRTISQLAHALGPQGLLTEAGDRARHACDASGLAGQAPHAVLRPASTDEVSAALALCHASGLNVVTQGGRTGLSGGGCVCQEAVALSTERMNGVISLDPASMSLTAWAGTPLQVIQEAARAEGLEYPVDLGARGTATIGGTVATNAGGIRVLRYGMTRENVLGLEAVLADGTVLSRLSPLIKDNSGLDLKHLFIGSEGIFGVITKVTVKLVPHVPDRIVALLGLADVAAALTVLGTARQSFGADLTAFEGMWPDYWNHVTGAGLARSPLEAQHGFYVLMEIAARSEAASQTFEAWIAEEFEAGRVSDGVLAKSLTEIEALWSVREAVGDVDPTFGPHINFDIGIDPARLDPFFKACDALLDDLPNAQGTLKVGHIGDGNVHLLVAHEAGDTEAAEVIERRVYALVATYHGAVTAEHGIGRIKRPYLDCSRSPAEIAVMKQLKRVLDPQTILNPGVMLDA